MRQTSRPLSSRGAVSAGRNSGTRTRIAPALLAKRPFTSKQPPVTGREAISLESGSGRALSRSQWEATTSIASFGDA
jgi:hypothetical protein